MFIHTLWSETDISLSKLATTVSDWLGVKAEIPKWGGTAELLIESRIEKPHDSDEGWVLTDSMDSRIELRPLRLYDMGFATGIASADPSLNFSLQMLFDREAGARPLRLAWNQVVAFHSDEWMLSATHLQRSEFSTEAVIQGPWGNPATVVAETDRFGDYEVVGVSLTDQDGRMLTLYDGGQLWLQHVGPDDVAGLFEKVVSQLVRRS